MPLPAEVATTWNSEKLLQGSWWFAQQFAEILRYLEGDESTISYVKMNDMRWFEHLIRVPPVFLLMEVVQAHLA